MTQAMKKPENVIPENNPFDADFFRAQGHALIDRLADYLQQAADRDMRVYPPETPQELYEDWPEKFPKEGQGGEAFQDIVTRTLEQCIHVHQPQYVGHQVTAPLPMAAQAEMVAALLNNSMAIYEMGQVGTIMERRMHEWMGEKIGWDPEKVGGIMTSGGSLGNLTALLAARQIKAGVDAWHTGFGEGYPPMAVMVSEQAHYCIKRALQIMGWGDDGAILVPVDDHYRMRAGKLEECYRRATDEGRKVIAVTASACSTSTGSFDPLHDVADFCEKHDLWMHVDGAHGASILVSEAYRHLLDGIERADSVVWDAHKMMMVPTPCTALLFREDRHAYAPFHQAADYLYSGMPEEEWYNSGQRTLECSRSMAVFKLYCCLMAYGTQFFDHYITAMIDRTRRFAGMIRESADFELAVEPACNIICYRHLPEGKTPDKETLSLLQERMRQRSLEEGEFYITQTKLYGERWLRCTFINPMTTDEDLRNLLDYLRGLAGRLK